MGCWQCSRYANKERGVVCWLDAGMGSGMDGFEVQLYHVESLLRAVGCNMLVTASWIAEHTYWLPRIMQTLNHYRYWYPMVSLLYIITTPN